MSGEQDRRVYRLEDEGDHEWADFYDDEVYPQQPRVSTEFRPLFITGEEVEELDDLRVYGFTDPPEFSGTAAIEATPQELAEWKAAGDRYLDVAGAFRRRMAQATLQYETAYEDGMRDLRAALTGYRPVEEQLKARGTELAAKLHEHREAARRWKEERYEKEQAHLDTIHGPRVVMLYEPHHLGSPNKANHIAKVHLETCNRQRGKDKVVPLRAQDAWRKLTDYSEWLPATWPGQAKNLRVKLCSFCKPWTVLMEHADVTVEDFRTSIKLSEWPEGLR